MELGKSKFSSELAVSLGLGDIISDVVDILKHSGEIWMFRRSLGDDILGIHDHVLNFLSAIHDVGVTDSSHGAVSLSFAYISHDVLDITHKLREVRLSSLDLRENVFSIHNKILDIFHAGSKISSLD